MPNWDSFRHVVVDSLLNASKHDTSAIKIALINSSPSSGNSGWQTALITAVGGIIGAGLGVWATVWYKKKELEGLTRTIKLQADNFELQKQRFEQDKLVQYNQISTELEKIKDLKNRYELSLKEFDFSKYEKLLEMAEKSAVGVDADKLAFLKELYLIIRNIKDHFPPSASVDDAFEAEREIASHIWGYSKIYIKDIRTITTKYPHLTATKELEDIGRTFKDLEYDIANETGNEPNDWDEVFDYHVKDFMSVYEKLDNLYKKCFEEFNGYDKIKTEFIKGMMKNDTQ